MVRILEPGSRTSRAAQWRSGGLHRPAGITRIGAASSARISRSCGTPIARGASATLSSPGLRMALYRRMSLRLPPSHLIAGTRLHPRWPAAVRLPVGHYCDPGPPLVQRLGPCGMAVDARSAPSGCAALPVLENPGQDRHLDAQQGHALATACCLEAICRAVSIRTPCLPTRKRAQLPAQAPRVRRQAHPAPRPRHQGPARSVPASLPGPNSRSAPA